MATVRFALVGVCYISEEHARLSGPPRHRDTLGKERCLVPCALSLFWPERSRAKTTWPGLSRMWYASFSCQCVNWFIDAKCGLLCVVCLSPPAFSLHRWIAQQWVKGSRVRQSSLPVHNLSVDKPFVEPPS